ncbi:MAG TPA: ABC transporter ATP-binding protein [Candidatus Limnocylindrales bacterium]|nr:ABC transporter ATP-binding protein [Candidatus Limnocylindrales bacterium]
MSQAEAIRLAGVTRHYRTPAGLVRAVDGIDLEIDAGATVAVVGPSGCGKSTLLSLLGGLDRPTSGQLWVGKQNLATLSDPARATYRRTHVGFIFQSYDLLPFLTAVENVAFQLSLQGELDGHDHCLELLDSLGLGDHADKLPDQLSGGQRQRVGIARALAHRPALILADEPTGELDSETSRSVMDLLLEAQRHLGATLVVVSHDVGVAQRLQRVLTLRDGRLVADSRSDPKGQPVA